MKSFFSLGLMSGSSLDGLDICYSRIDILDKKYSYEIINAETYAFPTYLLEELKVCRHLKLTELNSLDESLGIWFGNMCKQFIKTFNISSLDFICSHGHTVYHYPEKGITKQIGSGQEIAKITGVKTLNNLRQKDIDEGGSGSPIVPIGDLLFFDEFPFCLNLGGIMNISIKCKNTIISFDIGSCNQVLNHFASLMGNSFDKDGFLGKQGKFNSILFDEINALSFFSMPFPKSLDNSFSSLIIDICNKYKISINDKLNTIYHHLAYQIFSSLKPFFSSKKSNSILVTGGGSYNLFLIDLCKTMYDLNIILPDKKLIEFKEALVMSLIGVRYFEDKINVLSSVTGAKKDTISGVISFPITC